MKRLRKMIAAVLMAAMIPAAASAKPAPMLQITSVGRLPFPERGYLVDLERGLAINHGNVTVRENDQLVRSLEVKPLEGSGLRYGVVLAIDTSESMTGQPLSGALDAAKAFVAHRAANERVGVLA